MANKPLQPGQPVPAFSTTDHDGIAVGDADLRTGAWTVVYFYPKDDTPGCTAQACEFRDQHEAFTDAGATVFGVSADDAASHRAFRQKHNLPFRLLSDVDGSLKSAFGAKDAFGLLPARITFVIDGTGTVRKTFSSHLRPRAHIAEALELIAKG